MTYRSEWWKGEEVTGQHRSSFFFCSHRSLPDVFSYSKPPSYVVIRCILASRSLSTRRAYCLVISQGGVEENQPGVLSVYFTPYTRGNLEMSRISSNKDTRAIRFVRTIGRRERTTSYAAPVSYMAEPLMGVFAVETPSEIAPCERLSHSWR